MKFLKKVLRKTYGRSSRNNWNNLEGTSRRILIKTCGRNSVDASGNATGMPLHLLDLYKLSPDRRNALLAMACATYVTIAYQCGAVLRETEGVAL